VRHPHFFMKITRCEQLGVCQGIKCKKCPNKKRINISAYNKNLGAVIRVSAVSPWSNEAQNNAALCEPSQTNKYEDSQ